MSCSRAGTHLSRRALLVVTGALLVGACRVEPLYGSGEAPDALPRAVDLAFIAGRRGDLFRRALARRIRLTPEARHGLTVDLAIAERGLAITRAGDVTRYNLDGTARFALEDRAGEEPPLEGEVRAVVGYSALLSPFATRVAEEDAEARVVAALADRVFARIAGRAGA